jgi:PAS domain S-box-containing protein
MKARIVALFVVFLIIAIAAAALSFGGQATRTMIAGLMVISIVVVLLLIFSWLRFVSGIVKKTAVIVNDNKNVSRLSFENITRLYSHHDNIEKKLDRAVEYISKLSHPEQLDTMDSVLKDDKIGAALLHIRDEMHGLKIEENQRSWITQGLANFSEILRNKGEIHAYGHEIISNLVRYLGASQGGIFIEYKDEEDTRYMEMISSFAYDKRKFQEVKVYEGQGVLGQCMYEKEFILMTDVPVAYAKITSGLGEAAPRNIAVAPLMLNDVFYGVIELASFHVLKPHQIDFLKQVSVNIASEISSIKSMQQTERFLSDSRVLTQELQHREEEMKQSMEELVAIQDQMTRKQCELDSYLSAINNTIASAEFDLHGNFVTANDIFIKVMGYGLNELSGTPYHKFMRQDSSSQMMWENLRMGKFFSGEFKMRDKNGKELWLSGTFNPIVIGDGSPEKIMMFAQFTTQEKEKLNDMNVMVNALKSTLPVVEFNEQMICRTANEKFMKIFGLTRMSVKTKTIYDFIDTYYKGVFDKIKDELLSKDFSAMLLPMNIGGQIVQYEISVTVAQGLDGKISRVIMILVKQVEERVELLSAVR